MRNLLLSAAMVLFMAGTALAQVNVDILQVPKWGQSKADIMAAFSGAEAVDDDRINLPAGKAYGGDLITNYFFVEDRLMYARYNIEAFETEEFIVPQGYEDLLAGLKALHGEPLVREGVDEPGEGLSRTYILDWVGDERAIAFQRNGEVDAIYWMRVEHIDPAFLKQN